MNRRGLRLASLFEWLAAIGAVVAVVWLVTVPLQRARGPLPQSGSADLAPDLVAGVPATALAVPVLLLLDGREIRQGDLQADVAALLHEREADGPAQSSPATYGERHTRAYRVNGIRFYVVCERQAPDGPMRVASVYLP